MGARTVTRTNSEHSLSLPGDRRAVLQKLDSFLRYIAAAKLVAVEVASFIGLLIVLSYVVRHELISFF
jgi:hypothetical protein